MVLTGDYNEWFTQSYYALFACNQISDTMALRRGREPSAPQLRLRRPAR